MNRPVRILPVVGPVAAAAVGVGGGPAATTQATGPRLSTALGVRVKVAGEQLVGQDVELVATNQPQDRPVSERRPGGALEGDDQLFANQDTVEAEWQVVEPVRGDATPVVLSTRRACLPATSGSLCARAATRRDPQCLGNAAVSSAGGTETWCRPGTERPSP